jgi:hypothetical protein
MDNLCILVDILLELALVVLGVARGLLCLVAGDRADNSILLALDAVGGALDVALCTGSVVFGLAGGVLLLRYNKADQQLFWNKFKRYEPCRSAAKMWHQLGYRWSRRLSLSWSGIDRWSYCKKIIGE